MCVYVCGVLGISCVLVLYVCVHGLYDKVIFHMLVHVSAFCLLYGIVIVMPGAWYYRLYHVWHLMPIG